MASRNPITKKIIRRCPEVTDERGRELEVTIGPEDGGTISLRWSGDKGGPFKKETFRDLAFGKGVVVKTDESGSKKREVDLSKWCSYESLISFLHVVPVSSMKMRICMIKAVEAVRDHRKYLEWFGGGMTESWEVWKKKYSDEALLASAMPPDMDEDEA